MTRSPARPLGDDPVYAFLAAAPTPVLVVRADGLIEYVNTAACDAFGYRSVEMVGQPVEMVVPHGEAASHAQWRAGFMGKPSSRLMGVDRALNARRMDGTLFPAEISLVPVEWSGQSLVVATIMDITARLQDEAALRQISRSYLTLAEMNHAIVRATDSASLFAQTCRIAVDQGGYQGAWVGERGPGHVVRCVAIAGDLDEYVGQLGATTDSSDPRGRGPTGQVLRGGTSYYGQEFLADEVTQPWHQLGARFGIEATATLPLRCDGAVVATLTLYSTSPQAFTAEVRSLLEGMADNLSFALDGFDTVTKLREGARQRTELSQRLVAAQEAERTRIAADVHDDSVQSLAALDLRLGLLQRQVLAGAPEAVETVEELHRTVALVSAGLRDLLFQLEPPGPGLNLLDMLEEAAGHVFEDSDIACSVQLVLDCWDRTSTLSQTDRGQALRIVKEALFNVRKHSGATRVDVLVEPQAGGVEVEVRDDGLGFDADAGVAAPGHRGLANMLDRALVSGGWCRIASDASGTSVRLWMPYDESAPPFVFPTPAA
jgi:PAS domain S-box-containing protein